MKGEGVAYVTDEAVFSKMVNSIVWGMLIDNRNFDII
jgi:hypothetical protein